MKQPIKFFSQLNIVHIVAMIGVIGVMAFASMQLAQAEEPFGGNIYENNCYNYGALAAAVAYVRDEEIFTVEKLISDQIAYFEYSGVPQNDIHELTKMIRRVYESDISESGALFETYSAECRLARKDR